MIRSVFILSVLFVLTSCAAVIQHPTQEITIETPGTGGALCFLESESYRKRVWAPKTVRVIKSGEIMNVRCMAPGNREKIVVVRPHKPGNIFKKMAMYPMHEVLDKSIDLKLSDIGSYPAKVIVDFTDMPPTHMPLPEYQHVLEQNPDIAGLEEFRPGSAALLRDKRSAPVPLRPRQISEGLLNAGPGDEAMGSPETTSEGLTRTMNPAVFEGSSSSPSSSSEGGFIGGTSSRNPGTIGGPVNLIPLQE